MHSFVPIEITNLQLSRIYNHLVIDRIIFLYIFHLGLVWIMKAASSADDSKCICNAFFWVKPAFIKPFEVELSLAAYLLLPNSSHLTTPMRAVRKRSPTNFFMNTMFWSTRLVLITVFTHDTSVRTFAYFSKSSKTKQILSASGTVGWLSGSLMIPEMF